MKDILRTKSQKALDEEIERLTGILALTNVTEDKYNQITNNIKILCEAREKKNPLQIDINTLAVIGANVAGILIVLYFEKTNVITSKAFSMIFKGKS